MSDDVSNPYAAPESETVASPSGLSRWRFVPAIIFLVVGIMGFLMGIVATSLVVRVALHEGLDDRLVAWMITCAVFLAFGISWIAAGRLYWEGNYRRGVKATLTGIAAIILMVFIAGLWEVLRKL